MLSSITKCSFLSWVFSNMLVKNNLFQQRPCLVHIIELPSFIAASLNFYWGQVFWINSIRDTSHFGNSSLQGMCRNSHGVWKTRQLCVSASCPQNRSDRCQICLWVNTLDNQTTLQRTHNVPNVEAITNHSVHPKAFAIWSSCNSQFLNFFFPIV